MPSERDTMLRKPDWLKIRLPKSSEKIDNIKKSMPSQVLSSVCEASVLLVFVMHVLRYSIFKCCFKQ